MFRIHHNLLNASKNQTRCYGTLSKIINTNITNNYLVNNLTKQTALQTPWPDQQKRYLGRRGGASAFKVRPPTAKQRKRYNRRQKQLHWEKVGKHSAPGSKAGPRREMEKVERQRLLNLHYGKDEDKLLPAGGANATLSNNVAMNDEYTGMDAMIDDLIGNTGHLSSSDTPTRERIGYIYPQALESVQSQINEKSGLEDQEIALFIRSYRDTKTYKRRPIGIAAALRHIKEVGIPINKLSTLSYNALLSCASSPMEGLHLINDMKRNDIPRCPYTYSILVDLYANRGDFKSCIHILQTTLPQEGIEPSLAGYTSLLKACHKIVNRGATNSALKHEALDVAWQSWKHMRIHNIEADVMTYGAIINVYAAAGQAEKCLDLLNEMPCFEIEPTTFVFTAALRGVARSHVSIIFPSFLFLSF